MVSPEIQSTDSGYPTPRDDIPSSSRSESPTNGPMTSTPVRGRQNREMKGHFTGFRNDLSVIESIDEGSDVIKESMKSWLAMSIELKLKERMNRELRQENESLREENCSLREESRIVPPVIPKLQLGLPEDVKINDMIKQEIVSFFKNEQDRSIVEGKLEHMLKIETKEPKVFSATATIQVDADVQTEKEDHVNVIDANLKIEVDQLHSMIESTEKKNQELKEKLSDYEMKMKFEENEVKLRKESQEKANKYKSKIEELELRLNKKRSEVEKISAENQKLIDDQKTCEFELDELKIEAVESEKKLETLRKRVSELEESLEKEKNSKMKAEKDRKDTEEDHRRIVKELEEKVKNAMRTEKEAMRKLEEVQTENEDLAKNDKYYSEAKTALLESEAKLKNEANVMVYKLRNSEQKLIVLEENLADESKRKRMAEESVKRLEEIVSKLEKEKQDANELLDELKKGKLEIDHLRQQVLQRSEQSDEIGRLNEQIEETERKLAISMKGEAELEGKIDEDSRSNQKKIDNLTDELSRMKIVVAELRTNLEHSSDELQKVLKQHSEEFDDFRQNANLQYEHEIGVRDEELNFLRERLAELETYPGKTISISKRNSDSQTIPISKRNSEAQTDGVDLEKQVREVMDMMGELSQGCHDSSTVSEIFAEVRRLFAMLLDGVLTDREIVDMWDWLNRKMEFMEDEAEKRIDEAGRIAEKDVEKRWKGILHDVQERLAESENFAETRLEMAKQFKELYEKEQEENELNLEKYKELDELCKTELAEWQKTDKELRERLEYAEHQIQEKTRETLKGNEEQEEMAEKLRKQIESLKLEKINEQRKRAADKLTMKSMEESCEKMNTKVEVLRKRNSERQRLIEYMMRTMRGIQKVGDDEQTRRQLRELVHRAELSGLRDVSDDDNVDSTSSDLERRVLSSRNRQ